MLDLRIESEMEIGKANEAAENLLFSGMCWQAVELWEFFVKYQREEGKKNKGGWCITNGDNVIITRRCGNFGVSVTDDEKPQATNANKNYYF